MENNNLDNDYELYKHLEEKRDENKNTLETDYEMYKEVERKRDTTNSLNENLVLSIDPSKYSMEDRKKLVNVQNLKEVDNSVMFITKRGFKKHLDSKIIVTIAITGLMILSTIALDRVSNVADQYETKYNAYEVQKEVDRLAQIEKLENTPQVDKDAMDLVYDHEEYVRQQQKKEQQEFYQRYVAPVEELAEEEETEGKGLGK